MTVIFLVEFNCSGKAKNLTFDGHVGRPKYETENLVTYHCGLAPRNLELSASSSDQDYVDFFCFSYQKYIVCMENLFSSSISFSSQEEFSDIKIL